MNIEKLENEEIMTFTMPDDDGNDVEYQVLFTAESEETGKKYIAYTSDEEDEDGSTIVNASLYTSEDGSDDIELIPIEDDEDWEFVQSILDEIAESEE